MRDKWVKKRTLGAFAICCIMSMMLTGCQLGEKKFVLDLHRVGKSTVFSIDDTECYVKEAKLYLCNYKNLYGNAYGVDLWEADLDKASLEEYVRGVTLNELTKVYCMNMIAQQQGLTLTDKEKEQIDVVAEAYYQSLSSDEISYFAFSEEELKEFYQRYAMTKKIFEALTLEIDAEVSDDDARVIRIQQIFVSDVSVARKIKAELKKDADFMSLAGIYNELETAELDVARGKLPKEVEDIAFEMDNGEISSAIQTENGYYFIKCLNKFQKELTETNKAIILQQREKEVFENVYRDFVDKAKFQLNQKAWDSIEIDDMRGFKTNTFFECFEECM